MKKILFLLLCSQLTLVCYGQRFSYSEVEQVSAGGITYILDKTPISYFFDNIENTKYDIPYVNLDGTLAAGTWEDYDAGTLDETTLDKVIREVFTPQELADFKATNTRMSLFFIFDSNGKIIEASFRFNAKAPVIMLPVERIAQLEIRMKAEVTTHITDPATKNLQFVAGSYGYNFKYMDEK